MKKPISLAVIVILVQFFYFPGNSINVLHDFVPPVQQQAITYYKLTPEHMFQPSNRAKIDEVFLKYSSSFTLEEVDYAAGTVLIRMKSKAPFDDVKQAFDQVGMRIAKQELIIKS